MSSQTAWLLMMSLFRQVLWFVALCRVKGNDMAILWGHGSPLAKTESYAMCSNITSTVLFVLRYYRYVWLMSNILSVCKWKYENKSTNYLCWIVTKSYWSSFICTGQELDFLNFYINKFTCAIHFFHQMVDFTFWSSTYIWRICTICYKRKFEMIVDNLTVVYFYSHLYTTLFPDKIVKSNHYRHIFFHEKKNDQQFPSFFLPA